VAEIGGLSPLQRLGSSLSNLGTLLQVTSASYFLAACLVTRRGQTLGRNAQASQAFERATEIHPQLAQVETHP
jgi:hypothetical protein